ncbi:MAG: T9SS type A sorting domain-containing protein [Bacteroidales bacterium]|nr:T9SS type A sorting domain-containing protein [Bacteroidales bacterium]MBN2820774.1 T9SS type A sorting domain-containing protein [Bacteroidales bacterium]
MRNLFLNFKIAIYILGIAGFNLIGLKGQTDIDPITNVYKIGGESELFLSYTNAANTFSYNGILDIPVTLNDITTSEAPDQRQFLNRNKTASTTGDFNGDGIADVVTITDNTSGGIKISIPLFNQDLEITEFKEYSDEELINSGYERIRICAGNFDTDHEDEFALCYGKPGQTFCISMFETDDDLNITHLDSYKEIVYQDINFDFNSGDVDGDGTDEMVMVKNISMPYETNSDVDPPIFNSKYDLYVLKYDTLTDEIVSKQTSKDIILANQAPSDNYAASKGMHLNEIRLACGDFDADNKDEIAVAWSNYYCYYWVKVWDVWPFTSHWDYYYKDALFLNTFGLNLESNIENIENHFVAQEYYARRTAPANQHIALSLKCENLDNTGYDEILLNSALHFCIYASNTEHTGITKKVGLTVTGNMDIRGNETFVVADLNPDTANLDFNKEIILLKSEQNYINQLNGVATNTNIEIYELDSISPEVIILKQPGPAHDIPFDNTSNITITGLTTGDFDLENSQVYYVGIPDIFSVSDLQQPLVILNAPPVHFDVFNNVSYDLCSAFNSNENPPFYSTYNTEIGGETTTSVEVDNAFGFSSDLRVYAEAGGTGFEASVKNNFDAGKSFYHAVSQSKTIEEGKSVYTEDFVLYSSLDYSYYRYPVYNFNLEKLGYIGVLNPKSEKFVSSWGSGNTWEHPGYIFNHESGNLLSYKSCKNNKDMVNGTSEFISCDYSKVPVSHTGDGSFKFTFENIAEEGNSVSFACGVGADLFTKIGIEGTATINIGAFGIGGSISTDFRAGVSSELSSYFSSSTLKTHNTMLKNSFQIDGVIGRLNAEYDNNARYFITPYIYRSQCGALVLDYMIEFDEANMDWWENKYGQKPDLAFILPWRYATEKGGQNVKLSKKQKTNDIQFIKPLAETGDTVCIAVRIHNYSLKTFNERIHLNLYLGDPESNGILLEDIYGNSDISKDVVMMFDATEENLDKEEYFTFNWKVPDTITCSPRIYAKIDPDNEFEEIHENNNLGWNKLLIAGCRECSYAERTAQYKVLDNNSLKLHVYPNPVQTECNIEFFSDKEEHINIDLYNLSGTLVQNIANNIYSIGKHSIILKADHLDAGMYFLKVSANKSSSTLKLLITN